MLLIGSLKFDGSHRLFGLGRDAAELAIDAKFRAAKADGYDQPDRL